MRFFNTEGPVFPADHYCIPPLERLDLDEILQLVRDKKYFVLHAPRQTGKTSTLLALCDLLNGSSSGGPGGEAPRNGVGEYRCVYANLQVGHAAREDTTRAMRSILAMLAVRARSTLGDESLARLWPRVLETAGAESALFEVLSHWSAADARPLVLLLDEIDALIGDTLISVLYQLRAGYDMRPADFPQSVVLCGLRDIRDYRIQSGSANAPLPSPFNIKARSLRMGDFSPAEVTALLAQHTEDTGQAFAGDAVETIWNQTRGQPWLVNALASETCFRDEASRRSTGTVTVADVMNAREAMILRRETHLDALMDRLREDRVRRVIEPLLIGDERMLEQRDLEYVRDLGLIASDGPVRMANPIYAEVVPRELSSGAQEGLAQEAAWYVDASGGLRMVALMRAFQRFFRQNSEQWVNMFGYREAGPHLLLQAFLQRIVNSGGRVEREYALGRGRADLLVSWPQNEREGDMQRFVIECKLRRGSLEHSVVEGLQQTADYMDRCGAESGHLVIFDRGEGRWEDKVFHRLETSADKDIHIWGM